MYLRKFQIYEAANCTEGSLIVIFYFSEAEYLTSKQIVKEAGYEDMIDESIFLMIVEVIIKFQLQKHKCKKYADKSNIVLSICVFLPPICQRS